MEASVDTMTREYTAKLKASDANPDRRDILERKAARCARRRGRTAAAPLPEGGTP